MHTATQRSVCAAPAIPAAERPCGPQHLTLNLRAPAVCTKLCCGLDDCLKCLAGHTSLLSLNSQYETQCLTLRRGLPTLASCRAWTQQQATGAAHRLIKECHGGAALPAVGVDHPVRRRLIETSGHDPEHIPWHTQRKLSLRLPMCHRDKAVWKPGFAPLCRVPQHGACTYVADKGALDRLRIDPLPGAVLHLRASASALHQTRAMDR